MTSLDLRLHLHHWQDVICGIVSAEVLEPIKAVHFGHNLVSELYLTPPVMTFISTANPLAFLNDFILDNAFRAATATIAGTTAIFLLTSALYLAHWAFQRRHTAPGPPRLPPLGNLHQIPSELQFLQYAEWAKTHGMKHS